MVIYCQSLGEVFLVDDVEMGIYLKTVEENHGLCHFYVFQPASDATAFRRLPVLLVLWYKGILYNIVQE